VFGSRGLASRISAGDVCLKKQRYDMNAMKRTTRKAVAKAKEAIAEVLGDGNLREEAKADQRNAEQDNEKGPTVKPMGNLDQLT